MLAASWPTPREGKTTSEEMETWQKRKDAGGVATPPIGALVNTWPTPKQQNMNYYPSDHGQGGKDLQTTLHGNGINSSGCLARTEKFVDRLMTLSMWLMGYTVAYLGRWGTASSRRLQRKS